MSTAVAPATAAPLAAAHVDRAPSPKNYPTLAPSTSTAAPAASSPSRMSTGSQEGSGSKTTPDGKRTPPSTHGSTAPKIVVKKEPPSSPSINSQSRHRPRKLDLSASIPTSASSLSVRPPGGPLTARESMQEVGLACLSPGFQTQDPVRQEQLQRSMTVREQQRSIIESRLQKTAKGDGPEGTKPSESNLFGSSRSSKKRPPPGLSIVPPAASQFANERVIQSAPLNQTFTGRHDPPPLTRHVVNHGTTLASTSHIHHVPATQTNNRLPPLSDVFGSDLASRDRERDANRNSLFPGASGVNSSQSNNLPPLTSSPGNSSQPGPQRPREYRSAEEAVHELSGGREELLPRIVHYGGRQQPTTPPSPRANGVEGGQHHPGVAPTPSGQAQSQTLPHVGQGTSRRRTRSEYEQDNGSPPLGNGPDMRYRNGPGPAVPSYGPFGAGRDSPETQRRKKEEFLALCSRAWDLFHS
ncbi:hypothetical protein VTN77DRAFT_7160 [Rasamsonia byssochlamydoides]|uniref:uncharacterized protein n=1 Tax=Rasamsonia byssochlamydoides TaxID=89139 RepID=UPI003743FB7D